MRETVIACICPELLECTVFENVKREGRKIKSTLACRIICVESGEVEVSVGGWEYRLGRFDSLFLPTGTEYETVMRERVKLYSLTFTLRKDCECGNDGEYEKLRVTDVPSLNAPLLIPCSPELIEAAKETEKEFLGRQLYSSECADALLYRLVLLALRHSIHGTSTQRVRCTEVLGYIRESITRDIDCATVARHFGYHPNHLNKMIKLATGEPLSYHIRLEKLRYAASLLRETEKGITEIALLSGYGSHSHFSNAFRAEFRMTPREYRSYAQRYI